MHRAWPVTAPMASAWRRTAGCGSRIITVIGSYGKTTTARCVAAALSDDVPPPPADNHKVGVTRAMFGLRPSRRYSVIEIGIDKKGQMESFARVIRPHLTVVTSVGSEHNRSLGNIETTRNEKAKMVRRLPSFGFAVLNGDDPNVIWMAKQTRARVITYGFNNTNEVQASDIQLDWPDGMRFQLRANGSARLVRMRLFGRHMVYPILAAVAAGLAEGLDVDETVARLEHLKASPGRMEIKCLENGAILLCDYYKSSYETIVAALNTLSRIPARRRIVVLGEVSEPPGSQGPIYRDIGAHIARVACRAVFVGHNFQRYKAGATRGGLSKGALVNAGNLVIKAAEALKNDLGPGDVVLIKGRDTQRLDRVACALAGHHVRCTIQQCRLKHHRCHECPMLESGWKDLDVVT